MDLDVTLEVLRKGRASRGGSGIRTTQQCCLRAASNTSLEPGLRIVFASVVEPSDRASLEPRVLRSHLAWTMCRGASELSC